MSVITIEQPNHHTFRRIIHGKELIRLIEQYIVDLHALKGYREGSKLSEMVTATEKQITELRCELAQLHGAEKHTFEYDSV